jgi:hypothetical protein
MQCRQFLEEGGGGLLIVILGTVVALKEVHS